MPLRHLPNLISLLRIALVAPAIWLLLERRYGAALLVVLVAGVSDALDGWLAKRNGWHSALGAVLDPVADKTLLIASYLALAYLHLLPWWIVAVVLARDVVIVAGAIAFYLFVGRVEMAPSLSSKLNTVLQIVLVVAVIVVQIAAWVPNFIVTALVWLVTATSVWSGVSYVLVWGAQALRVSPRE